MPEANVMSYKTKTDRDNLMAVRTGAKKTTNTWGHSHYKAVNHVAVHVRLTDVKKDFVSADVDFVDLREKKDSQGGHRSGLDVLVYVQSQHHKYEWKKDASGNWASAKVNSNPLSDDEGYLMCYGGQGDRNPMTHREFLEIGEISEAVRKFLIDRVLPFKRGEFVEKDLTLVA